MSDCENCNDLPSPMARLITILAIVLLLVSGVAIIVFGLPALNQMLGNPTHPNVYNTIPSTLAASQVSTPTIDESNIVTPNIIIPNINKPNITSTPSDDASQNSQAVAILALVNAARNTAGLSGLRLNEQLTQAALLHSQDQAAQDVMSHDGSDGSKPDTRVTQTGYTWHIVGENVLERGDLDASAAYNQWWDSPPHHENMMNPQFTDIGLGYARSASGRFYYTMVLAAPA